MMSIERGTKMSTDREYTAEEYRRLGNMVRTTLAYEPYQLDAIYGRTEMTREIFKECLKVCIKTDNGREFYDLCESFPQFLEDEPSGKTD